MFSPYKMYVARSVHLFWFRFGDLFFYMLLQTCYYIYCNFSTKIAQFNCFNCLMEMHLFSLNIQNALNSTVHKLRWKPGCCLDMTPSSAIIHVVFFFFWWWKMSSSSATTSFFLCPPFTTTYFCQFLSCFCSLGRDFDNLALLRAQRVLWPTFGSGLADWHHCVWSVFTPVLMYGEAVAECRRITVNQFCC